MQIHYTTECCSSNGSKCATPLFWQAVEEYKRLEAMSGLEWQHPETFGPQDAYWDAVTSPSGLIADFYQKHQPVILAWVQKTAASAKEADAARLESVRRGMGYGNLEALFSWELGACYALWEASQRAAAVYAPFPLGTATGEARSKEYKSPSRRSSSSSSGGGGDGGDDSGGSGDSDPEPPASTLCLATCFPLPDVDPTQNIRTIVASSEMGWC